MGGLSIVLKENYNMDTTSPLTQQPHCKTRVSLYLIMLPQSEMVATAHVLEFCEPSWTSGFLNDLLAQPPYY